MVSSTSLTPFAQLPRELVVSILDFAQEPNARRVCKLWAQILEDTNLTFLQRRMLEWGMEREINQLNFSTYSDESIKVLKERFIERILFSLNVKQLKALTQLAPTYCLFLQIFSYEKDGNLLFAFEALAKTNQKLKEFFQNSSFQELSVPQKAKRLRIFLEGIKDNLATVEEFDLNNKKLTLIPEELNLFTNAKVVKLAFNLIKKLPSNFGTGWTKLKELHLNDNQITNLPENFGSEWKEMEKIFLYANSIENLPARFGESWTKVKHVLLSRNQIEALPLNFGSNWKGLLEINVSNNKAKLNLDPYVSQWPKIRKTVIKT